MSAAVLLIRSDWGTTKRRSQTQWEAYLAPHFCYWSRTQNSYYYSPDHVSAFCLTTGTEQSKTHISTSVCSIFNSLSSVIGKSRRKLATNRSLPGFHIDCRAEAAATTDTIDIQKSGHEGPLILQTCWKESVVALPGDIAPFFSLL